MKTQVNSTGPAGEQPAVPSPSKRALKRRKARQHKRAREEADVKRVKEQEEKGLTTQANNGPGYGDGGGSESGQSDNTLGPTGTVFQSIDNRAVDGTTGLAVKTGDTARAIDHEKPSPGKTAEPTRPVAVEKPLLPISPLPKKPTPKVNENKNSCATRSPSMPYILTPRKGNKHDDQRFQY